MSWLFTSSGQSVSNIYCQSLCVSTSLCLSIPHLSLYHFLCVSTYPAIYPASICLCIFFNRSPMYTPVWVCTYLSVCLEYSNYCTIALISHAGKVMLKILQARLQQFVNRELSDVQACFRKGRGTRDQIANIHWIIKKAREFQKKNIYFCFIDYAKAFDCVDHNKLWKILKEMGIPDHLTCLLRNIYAGQEATVRTGYGTTD